MYNVGVHDVAPIHNNIAPKPQYPKDVTYTAHLAETRGTNLQSRVCPPYLSTVQTNAR